MRLLAIDDNNDNLLTLKALMSAFLPGASLVTALSGPEGLALASSQELDAILLDIQMPGMDGFEVTRRLKGDPATLHIPIIILTAQSTDLGSKVKALDCGADAFLAKPLDETELVAQVKAMVRIKRSEDALRKERDRLEDQVSRRMRELNEKQRMNQLLLDALPHYAYLVNEDRKIIATNRIAADNGARVGDYCWACIHKLSAVAPEQKRHYLEYGVPLPGTRCHHCRRDEAIESQKIVTAEVMRDNSHWEVSWIPINRSVHLTYIMDITERKLAEEERRLLEQQFHHAQKLESLGVLTGGIAHDFNNIMTIILGYCYMASKYLSSEQDFKESFQKVEAAANRASDLCRQMMTYAGNHPTELEKIMLVQQVDEVVNMLQSTLKKNVTIELGLSKNVPIIIGDNSQIQQIAMNLVINAAEAIGEDNGTIKVSVSKTVVEAGKTMTDAFGTVIPPGSYACLEVTDTGCGMGKETQKRIFEPFYTTKFTGRGLGMSAIRGIVKSHSGALLLTSTPGIGTTFKVYFPVPAPAGASETVPTTPALTSRAAGTVLLVDDEEILSSMSTSMLGAMGFTILTAQNGREALDVYHAHSSKIDVVLLDLLMPVMGGIEFYHVLRTLSSSIPIVMCSGYGSDSVDDIIHNDERTAFIYKPYKPEELSGVLMKMIDK